MSNEIELTVKGTPEAIGRLLNPLRAEYVPPSISVPAIALEDIDGPDLPTLSAKPDETTRTVTMQIDPALAEWATEGSDKPDLPVMNAKPKSDESGDWLTRWRLARIDTGIYQLTMPDGTKITTTLHAADGRLVDRDFDIIWR